MGGCGSSTAGAEEPAFSTVATLGFADDAVVRGLAAEDVVFEAGAAARTAFDAGAVAGSDLVTSGSATVTAGSTGAAAAGFVAAGLRAAGFFGAADGDASGFTVAGFAAAAFAAVDFAVTAFAPVVFAAAGFAGAVLGVAGLRATGFFAAGSSPAAPTVTSVVPVPAAAEAGLDEAFARDAAAFGVDFRAVDGSAAGDVIVGAGASDDCPTRDASCIFWSGASWGESSSGVTGQTYQEATAYSRPGPFCDDSNL